MVNRLARLGRLCRIRRRRNAPKLDHPAQEQLRPFEAYQSQVRDLTAGPIYEQHGWHTPYVKMRSCSAGFGVSILRRQIELQHYELVCFSSYIRVGESPLIELAARDAPVSVCVDNDSLTLFCCG